MRRARPDGAGRDILRDAVGNLTRRGLSIRRVARLLDMAPSTVADLKRRAAMLAPAPREPTPPLPFAEPDA